MGRGSGGQNGDKAHVLEARPALVGCTPSSHLSSLPCAAIRLRPIPSSHRGTRLPGGDRCSSSVGSQLLSPYPQVAGNQLPRMPIGLDPCAGTRLTKPQIHAEAVIG